MDTPQQAKQPQRRRRQRAQQRLRDAQIAARRAAALELRLQGGTYRQIANQLAARDDVVTPEGYSEGLAFKDVSDELGRLADLRPERTAHALELHILRLESLYAKVFPNLKTGNEVRILEALLWILDRLAKYQGLDSPAFLFNLTIPWDDLTPEQLDRLAASEDPRKVLSVR